jgi:hypothetical protein
MITRFMLISPARSGSTMIGATLAGHPQVHMHGEVMGPRHVQTARRAYLPEAVKALSPEEFSRTMLLERSQYETVYSGNTICCGREKEGGGI